MSRRSDRQLPLANDILMQLVKGNTGQYQSGDYFSLD